MNRFDLDNIELSVIVPDTMFKGRSLYVTGLPFQLEELSVMMPDIIFMDRSLYFTKLLFQLKGLSVMVPNTISKSRSLYLSELPFQLLLVFILPEHSSTGLLMMVPTIMSCKAGEFVYLASTQ